MRFVTDVEFGQLNGPGRHPSCPVWFLQYLLNWVISFDDDAMILEVWALGVGGGLRVPRIGPTFPPFGIWFLGLTGFC